MKKEIIFFENNSPFNLIERGGAFNKIIILEGVTKIVGGNNPDLDITAYDEAGDISWSIWTIKCVYSIFDEQSRFFDYPKDIFLEKIMRLYPDDFEFFLWNPEIFDGIYNDVTDPEPETQSISQNGA